MDNKIKNRVITFSLFHLKGTYNWFSDDLVDHSLGKCTVFLSLLCLEHFLRPFVFFHYHPLDNSSFCFSFVAQPLFSPLAQILHLQNPPLAKKNGHQLVESFACKLFKLFNRIIIIDKVLHTNIPYILGNNHCQSMLTRFPCVLPLFTRTLSRLCFHYMFCQTICTISHFCQVIVAFDNCQMTQLSTFRDQGSLGRRVKCRRVPQPRWVGARRSAKGGRRRPERERERGRGGNPAAFVFVPRPGRVRLQ
jgi:hypothetical protein